MVINGSRLLNIPWCISFRQVSYVISVRAKLGVSKSVDEIGVFIFEDFDDEEH